jgi:hypothetical protein
MVKKWQAWGRRPFQWTLFACAQFVLFSTLAMWLYPGGSFRDPASPGYSFFNNFFSELGLTVTRSGAPNTPSLVLFVIALTLAGLGLVVFCIAVPQFFWHRRGLRLLSILGSVFGVLSGLCFIGVAWTPANLVPAWHGTVTLWAFQAYLVVAVIYSVATLLHPNYPKVFALAYVAFAALLAGYVWLMMNGPAADTVRGVMIQATGQKAIVYAAIVCMFVQSYGALRLRASGFSAPHASI